MKQVCFSPKSANLPRVIGKFEDPLPYWVQIGTIFFLLLGIAVAHLKKYEELEQAVYPVKAWWHLHQT